MPATSGQRWGRQHVAGAPGLVVLLLWLAFAVRLACLDCQSLWLDEITAAFWTSLPTRAMLLDIADNLHTPAYYVMLDGWVALAGSSAFSLRSIRRDAVSFPAGARR
jgi:predicted membrane-bound mannosyltransferase